MGQNVARKTSSGPTARPPGAASASDTIERSTRRLVDRSRAARRVGDRPAGEGPGDVRCERSATDDPLARGRLAERLEQVERRADAAEGRGGVERRDDEVQPAARRRHDEWDADPVAHAVDRRRGDRPTWVRGGGRGRPGSRRRTPRATRRARSRGAVNGAGTDRVGRAIGPGDATAPRPILARPWPTASSTCAATPCPARRRRCAAPWPRPRSATTSSATTRRSTRSRSGPPSCWARKRGCSSPAARWATSSPSWPTWVAARRRSPVASTT